MRIIAGTYRGRTLRAPRSGTRPTTDRTREAIFNLLAARLDLHDVRVLDLFAGSGALGLEAISRGAARVTFVEQHGGALATIRQNAKALEVEDQCVIQRGDAVRFLEQAAGAYDVVFADPPYELEAMERLPDLVRPHLAPGGLFVLEHSTAHDFEGHAALETSRKYGRTVVSLFGPDVEKA